MSNILTSPNYTPNNIFVIGDLSFAFKIGL